MSGGPALNAHDLSQPGSGATAVESTPVGFNTYAVGAGDGTPVPGSSLSGDGKRVFLTGQIAFSGIVTGGTVVAKLSAAAHFPAATRTLQVRRVGANAQTTMAIDNLGQITLGSGTAAADTVSLDGLSYRLTP